jgi:hypothetical protein
MIEFFLLMTFNLLYPDKNKTGLPKDEMNTAAGSNTHALCLCGCLN